MENGEGIANPPAGPDEEWLRTPQVAAILGVSKETVRGLYRTSKLRAYRPSKKAVRFRRADVEAYIRRMASGDVQHEADSGDAGEIRTAKVARVSDRCRAATGDQIWGQIEQRADDLIDIATAAVKLGVDAKDAGRKMAAKLRGLPPEMLAAMLMELRVITVRK
jgi:excisionase family DNA binding protein